VGCGDELEEEESTALCENVKSPPKIYLEQLAFSFSFYDWPLFFLTQTQLCTYAENFQHETTASHTTRK